MNSPSRLRLLLGSILCCALVAASPVLMSVVKAGMEARGKDSAEKGLGRRGMFEPPQAAQAATVSGAGDFFAAPAQQPSGGKIVFASNRDGQAQIYLMNVDGSGQTKLANDPGNNSGPRWSPDGTRILFQSDRDNPDTGYNDIYVMNVGGTNETRLTADPNDDSSASWSPDGTRIVFQSFRNGMFYQVYSMNADGSNQVNLSNSGATDGQPSWSPDGTKIAFTSDRDHAGFSSVYVMNADGSQQTRLTWSDAPFRDEQPVWSPDGTKLAFTSTRDSVIETWQETGEDGGVVQRSAIRTNKEVYVMNADGSNPVRLTNSLGNDDSPYWSPNGSQIVFRSDRERDCCDPTSQVWVMSSDGTGQGDLSGSGFEDYSPSWSVGGTGKTLPTAEAASAPTNTVTINFDNIPTGQLVTNQYLPYATFSASGFSAGPGGPNGSDLYTAVDSGVGGSAPNGIISMANWNPVWNTQDVFVQFKMPVNNLRFNMLNSRQSNWTLCRVDVFVNHSYNGSYSFQGNGGDFYTFPVTADFRSISDITEIYIHPVTNYNLNLNHIFEIYYDDFSFTPDLNINITNSRVDGNLQGTTQNALIGGDVSLQASANRTGGTYSWSFTGSPTVVSGATNQASIEVRWTQTGTYRATVSYTLNGIPTSSNVDVNVIIPKLTSFTATEVPDEIDRDKGCSGLPPGATHTIGCAASTETGTVWTATATIPSGRYLSDPSDSGIKFLQAINEYNKRIDIGNFQCLTHRSGTNEAAFDSGWQLDTDDPYNHFGHGPFYFSDNPLSPTYSITMSDYDAPGHSLDGTYTDGKPFSRDVYYRSDTFADYVFYYTGSPGDPVFQRAIGFQNSSLPYARLLWTFNAQASFNFGVNFLKYRRDFTSTSAGSLSAEAVNAVVDMSSNVTINTWVTCPGTTATTNPIDGSEFFVKQHYYDFLLRNDPARDQGGYDFWRTQITQCGFTAGCIDAYRLQVSRAFWDSADFQNRPDIIASGLLNPPGSARPYDNSQFVRWCYKLYLNREPDGQGWNFWLNDLNSSGDYNHIIHAFLLSTDYRIRFGAP